MLRLNRFTLKPVLFEWKTVLPAFCLMAVMLLSCPFGALAADNDGLTGEVVGSVKTVTGEAFLRRGEKNHEAYEGDYLYRGDVLLTSSDSSLGVIFRDDTILSLGSKSEVRIDQFVFDPAHSNMDFLVNVGKGTAQFISGQIAKLQPESMSVETPLSTIGIRGTRFLVKVD